MNKKNIFLSLFIFSFLFSNVFPVVEREFSLKLVKTIESKEEVNKRIASGELAVENEMALSVKEVTEDQREEFERVGLRSIETKFTPVEFDKTAFGGENKFYLGSGIILNCAKSYALTLAQIVADSNTGRSIVDFVPFSPQLIVVNNDVDDDKKPQQTENPVYGQKIEQLTLDGSSNLVASFNRNTGGGDNKEPQVCLTRSDLSALFTHRKDDNIVDINDASGSDVASGVVGLCAGNGKVFAAVTPKDKTDFGEPNSGFAVLVSKRSDVKDSAEERLSIVNANNGMIDGNIALELDLGAGGGMVAIDSEAKISGLGDMYWDSTLQRLFVVLTSVTQEDVTDNGGVVCLLVGRLDSDKLILESSIELDGSFFKKNAIGNNVVGFYADDNNQYYASGYKVRVMHTSTGFSYLIINGGKEITNDGGAKVSVYALPIVKKNNDKEKIGKISQKNNFDEVIDAADQLLDVVDAADQKLAFVGNANLPLTPGAPDNESVEHMFVEGDSVFVCLAGDRGTNEKEAGIFKSTALFDENGKIFAWTAWQRVMGSTDVVYGGGLDRGLSANSGNYWYLTKDSDNKKTTVKVTQWGVGQSAKNMMGQHLVPFLSEQFTHEIAGVHQIFNFDEQTSGFNADAFSMMIATGYKKVILLETGSSSGGAFNPTPDFSDPDKYKTCENDVLNEIGPICCAETSRIANDGDKGWVFVGGYGGLAVLSDAAGDGWDTVNGLANLTADLTAFTFKKVHDFSHVRKLICDGVNKKLYIVGDQTISRISTDNKNFVIETTINISDIVGNNDDFISDFMICGDLGLVATISGLFKAVDINTNPTTWEEVKIDSGVVGVGQVSIGPVQSFNFVSNLRGGVVDEGNLYVLLADIGLDLATVYRFQITGNDIKRIKEDDDRRYFYQIGEFRSNFIQDGVFGFHLLPKHFGMMGFLKKINIGSNISTFRTSERRVGLNVDDDLAYNVGLMVKNSATGAWVVPGDWGIRVQE